jgi:adenosylhomocysteine nucleosidase
VILATTGVGKVNAAATTALVIERFAPAIVIFSGVAGALDPALQPGDVVIAERLLQHDLVRHTEQGPVLRGVRDPAGVVGPIVLEASPALLALARDLGSRLELERLPGAARGSRLRFGTIATGDSFVSALAMKTQLHERLSADAVEMEGAAVAQVCARRGIPLLVVRGLSDGAAGDAPEEARRNLALAAGNAARTALAVARAFVESKRR